MRRILLMVLRNIFFVPVYWYKLCYHARHVDKYTEEEHYKLLKYIDHRANTSGNIHIEVHGQENIPEQDGFMFYPNHQGLYDVLAIMEACPRPFAVVAKKEVADVPFLRQGNQVQAFKGGSFKAATRARCPIIPVALINCFVPFDSKTTEHVNVQVHFLEPLLYEEYKDMKTTEIAAIVRERIQHTINENV